MFEFTRSFEDTLGFIKDVYSNNNFTRFIDGKDAKVDDNWAKKYSNSINSVIYFTLLPYGLNDGAVKKRYVRKERIKGKEYDLINVSFKEKNGGEDHKDEFYYLINVETKEVDYFGYTYETDGGGIRFREAYNKRMIKDVLFQDYLNYSPEKSIEKETTLDQVLELYKSDQLNVLSKIELTNIKVG